VAQAAEEEEGSLYSRWCPLCGSGGGGTAKAKKKKMNK